MKFKIAAISTLFAFSNLIAMEQSEREKNKTNMSVGIPSLKFYAIWQLINKGQDVNLQDVGEQELVSLIKKFKDIPKDFFMYLLNNPKVEVIDCMQFPEIVSKYCNVPKGGKSCIVKKQALFYVMLIDAIESDNELLVNTLLNAGADVNYQNRNLNCNGETALMIAVAYGRIGIIDILLKEKANVETATFHDDGLRRISGSTALMFACRARENISADTAKVIVKMLIHAGANVNAKTVSYSGLLSLFGSTALMHAAESGYTEILQILIENGADVNAKNHSGKTALDFAKKNNHTDAIKLLENYTAS